jgi:hypothetical protein
MDEVHAGKLQAEIAELEQRLVEKKRQLEEALSAVARSGPPRQSRLPSPDPQGVNNYSSPEDKIVLFQSLFRGREDIYAKRFESKKTGKSGYQPCCRNEWTRGQCEKSRISCSSCSNRDFEPVTDRVIRTHLAGCTPASYESSPVISFVMGIYPLLQNETCCFLAVDFDSQGGRKTAGLINSFTEQPEDDKHSWQEDAKAFMETCRIEDVPASLERSYSGNSAHIWIFFDLPQPGHLAQGRFRQPYRLPPAKSGVGKESQYFPER